MILKLVGDICSHDIVGLESGKHYVATRVFWAPVCDGLKNVVLGHEQVYQNSVQHLGG